MTAPTFTEIDAPGAPYSRTPIDISGLARVRGGGSTTPSVPQPGATRTTAWDIPKQRLDGAWIVLHPENHPSSQDTLPNGQKMVDFTMQGVTYSSIEEWTPTWFPPPASARP